MKIKTRILTSALALGLCASMAISASAAFGASAGIYGTISGRSSQDSNDLNLFNTTTSVSQNPDLAYLRTSVDFQNELKTLTKLNSMNTVRGATRYDHGFPIQFTIEGRPTQARVAHQVLGGTQAPKGYTYYDNVPKPIK